MERFDGSQLPAIVWKWAMHGDLLTYSRTDKQRPVHELIGLVCWHWTATPITEMSNDITFSCLKPQMVWHFVRQLYGYV